MENEIKDIELIEKYLEGKIQGDEIKNIEDRLDADLDFKKLYDDTKILIEGIKQTGSKETHQNLRNLDSTLPEIKLPSKTLPLWKSKRFIGIAASVIILAVASILVIYLNKPVDNKAIFAEYFEVYPNVVKPQKRSETNQLSLEERAFRSYESLDFELAIELFEKSLVLNQPTELKFYLGVSYLAMNDAKQSAEIFKEIVEERNVFENQALWYLGLCKLLLEEEDEAKNIFTDISKSNSSYKSRAENILLKIK